MKILKTITLLGLICSLLFAADCNKPVPSPNGPDSTPASIQMFVALVKRDGSGPTDWIDVPTDGVNRPGIPTNLMMKVKVILQDNDSGLKTIALDTNQGFQEGENVFKQHNLKWSCNVNGTRTQVETLDLLTASPAFKPMTTPALTSVEFTVDPVTQVQCANGYRTLSGFIRVVVTNGGGTTSLSNTVIFDYKVN